MPRRGSMGYATANEVGHLRGDGELPEILFTLRSSALKSTRRARIRLLVRLSRLIDEQPIEMLRDLSSAPHGELGAILQSLAHAEQLEAGQGPAGIESPDEPVNLRRNPMPRGAIPKEAMGPMSAIGTRPKS